MDPAPRKPGQRTRRRAIAAVVLLAIGLAAARLLTLPVVPIVEVSVLGPVTSYPDGTPIRVRDLGERMKFRVSADSPGVVRHGPGAAEEFPTVLEGWVPADVEIESTIQVAVVADVATVGGLGYTLVYGWSAIPDASAEGGTTRVGHFDVLFDDPDTDSFGFAFRLPTTAASGGAGATAATEDPDDPAEPGTRITFFGGRSADSGRVEAFGVAPEQYSRLDRILGEPTIRVFIEVPGAGP